MTSLYEPSHRALQEEHHTRKLADRLESMARPQFDDNDRQFIEGVSMFFLASVNSEGMPTVSYKGGAPGFVKITAPDQLVFPAYDGNGMFLSLGNIAGTGKVGLLFIDFEHPRRLRVQGSASLLNDPLLLNQYPGAQHLVRVQVSTVFVNCGRYIHPSVAGGLSRHVPDASGNQPFPSWKRIDVIADALSPPDQGAVKNAGGTMPFESYKGED